MKAIVLDASTGKGKASGKDFGIIKLAEQKQSGDFFNVNQFFCDPSLLKGITRPALYEVELGLGDFGDKPSIRSVRKIAEINLIPGPMAAK